MEPESEEDRRQRRKSTAALPPAENLYYSYGLPKGTAQQAAQPPVEKTPRNGTRNHSGGSGLPPPPPAPPPNDPSSSDDSDPEPDWNDHAARKRYLKHKVNARVAEAFKKGNREAHPMDTWLLPKKSIPPKPFTGVSGELDDFLRKIENVFALNKAYYPLDLNKIYYAAELRERQAARWCKNVHFLVNEEAA